MSPDTATAWASRLLGDTLAVHNVYNICNTILNKVCSEGINFRLIGEVWHDEAQYMLITQSAKFDGYKGMAAGDIPQFKEGEIERKARSLLNEEGASLSTLDSYI